MDTQPGEQGPQAKHPGNSKHGRDPYRGDENSDDSAPLDPKRKRRQQHHGSQRIKAGDTEGEGRSEERQHRQRLLGSHLTDGRTDRSVAQ